MATTIDAKLASRLRAKEPAILQAITQLGEKGARNEDWFIVPDKEGKPLYAILFHNLWQEEYEELQRKHTRPGRDPDTGLEIPEFFNRSAYQSDVIRTAMDAEDRAALCDNPEVRRAYKVTSNLAVIEPMLGGPGIKQQVVNFIDRLGRYGQPLLGQEDLEKLLGNSSGPEEDAQSSTETGSGTMWSHGLPSELTGSPRPVTPGT